MTTYTVTASRDAEFRAEWWHYVRNHAEPWHHAVLSELSELYDRWTAYNTAYYGGPLCPPYMLLTVPSSSKAYADTSPVSSFGAESRNGEYQQLAYAEYLDCPHPGVDDVWCCAQCVWALTGTRDSNEVSPACSA